MKVCNEIKIESTLDKVWSNTIDVESWPSWNPVMNNVSIQGTPELSLESKVLINQEGMKPCIWTIQELREGEIFSWQTKISAMRLLAIHEISRDGDHVRNKLTLEVHGVMAFLLWPLLKKPMQKALIDENNCFKKFCETKN